MEKFIVQQIVVADGISFSSWSLCFPFFTPVLTPKKKKHGEVSAGKYFSGIVRQIK